MPLRGPLVVDVPGVVEGWHQLLTRFGTIDLGAAVAPAIAFAHDGFPVAELMANEWRDNESMLAADPATAATFLPRGVAPRLGEIFANPRSCEIARNDREERTRCVLHGIDRARRSSLTCNRAADCSSSATSPITGPTGSSRSRRAIAAVDLLEMPPSTQGFVALEMLNIMEGYDVRSLGHNSADYLHRDQ